MPEPTDFVPPVTETVNHVKNRIEVQCSPDPNSRDHRPLGYVDDFGDYHLPNGTTLPASGGVTDPNGEHRHGAIRLFVRPDGGITSPETADAADPAGTARGRMHAVDARQQAEYDAAQQDAAEPADL